MFNLIIGFLLVSSAPNFEILRDYGVDPCFGKAVAVVESGWNHGSNLAINKNNIFGMHGMSFNSVDECIHYFGVLMNKPIYKAKSIDEIGRIYCPANAFNWSEKVKAVMAKISGKWGGVSCTGNTIRERRRHVEFNLILNGKRLVTWS